MLRRSLYAFIIALLCSCANDVDEFGGDDGDQKPADALEDVAERTQAVTNNEFQCWSGCYGEWANGQWYAYQDGGGSQKVAEFTSQQRWEGWANDANQMWDHGFANESAHYFTVQKYGAAKTIGNIEFEIQWDRDPAQYGRAHFNLCITNYRCVEWVFDRISSDPWAALSWWSRTNGFAGYQWPSNGTIEFSFGTWLEGSGAVSPTVWARSNKIRVYYQ